MGAGAPKSSTPPSDLRGVRKMLVLFGILGVLGVLILAVSVLVGIIFLVAAEAFFLIAYRRFSKSSRSRA